MNRTIFTQKTEEYQKHLRNQLNGQIVAYTLKEQLGSEPTNEDVALISTLDRILYSEERDGKLKYWQTVEAPVEYLFSKLTSHGPEVYLSLD